MDMDIVFIEGLTITTFVGIYDWEKTRPQKLVFDIEMAWDNSLAGKTDDIAYCLDYAKVSHALQNYLEQKTFLLIERVAEEAAHLLLTDFQISQVRVKVSKPGAVPQASQVGVIIKRHKISSC